MSIGMTAVELHAVREALRERLRMLDKITATCVHCEHFATAQHCDKFDATPPADFRVAEGACEEWRFDGVPF